MLNNIRTKTEIKEKLDLFKDIVDSYEEYIQPEKITSILDNLNKENCKAAFQELFGKEDFYFQVAKKIGIINSLGSIYNVYKMNEEKYLSSIIVDIEKTVKKYNADDAKFGDEHHVAKKEFIPQTYKLIEIIEKEDDKESIESLERLKLLYTARFFAISSTYKADGMNIGFMYLLKQINEIDEIKIS